MFDNVSFSSGLFLIATVCSVFFFFVGLAVGREIKKPSRPSCWLKDLIGLNYKMKPKKGE